MALSYIPATLVATGSPNVVPIAPPTVLNPSNAWITSDGVNMTSVYAGAAGTDSTEGRFVIVRSSPESGTEQITVVSLPGSGSVRIASSAPAGPTVETSAQQGDLPYVTASGAGGELNLATDSVVVGSS
jgi:hypothetical protein